MTTQRAWHVAEGREQVANVKERWHTNGTNQCNKPHQTSDKTNKAHMTTQGKWHVGEGREQKGNVKDRWQTKGTNQFKQPHKMSET